MNPILWFILGGVFGGLLASVLIIGRVGKFLTHAISTVNYFERKAVLLEREFTDYIEAHRKGVHYDA